MGGAYKHGPDIDYDTDLYWGEAPPIAGLNEELIRPRRLEVHKLNDAVILKFTDSLGTTGAQLIIKQILSRLGATELHDLWPKHYEEFIMECKKRLTGK